MLQWADGYWVEVCQVIDQRKDRRHKNSQCIEQAVGLQRLGALCWITPELWCLRNHKSCARQMAPSPPVCYDKSWLYNAQPTTEGVVKHCVTGIKRLMADCSVFWPTSLPGTLCEWVWVLGIAAPDLTYSLNLGIHSLMYRSSLFRENRIEMQECRLVCLCNLILLIHDSVCI